MSHPMRDHDAEHDAALDAMAAQDASGFGQEAPPYVAPRCEECNTELVAADWDDADGRVQQAMVCEACESREEER